MTSKDALEEYRGKRDFSRTAEPRPDVGGATGGPPRFLVQIHDATRVHFDFRLEVDGVLKSWAVPKGPSADPRVKRLAVPTEDHPLEYRDFEGVIAQGGYGAGTVIIWDEGTYRNLVTDRDGNPVPFGEALDRGHVSFALDGGKLRGGYALTRMHRAGADDNAWLLVKRGGRPARRGAPDPLRARSARTGRTLRQTAELAGSGA